MSPENYGQLVTALLGATVVAALPAWSVPGRRIWTPVLAALLTTAAVLAAWPEQVEVPGRGGVATLTVLAGLAALAGGGPLTARLFAFVDRQEVPNRRTTLDAAGTVLRGGAWIGVLERGAVFASLVGGWPEGLAVVLALKGLGRYPELRAAEDGVRTGAAERFIIGTFSSVLWAAACAGVVLLVRR